MNNLKTFEEWYGEWACDPSPVTLEECARAAWQASREATLEDAALYVESLKSGRSLLGHFLQVTADTIRSLSHKKGDAR